MCECGGGRQRGRDTYKVAAGECGKSLGTFENSDMSEKIMKLIIGVHPQPGSKRKETEEE